MRRIPLTDPAIRLCGLPWFEANGGQLWRLPAAIRERISAELWMESVTTSGVRLCFRSDTTMLGIAGEFGRLTGSIYPGHLGSAGTDAYVDGRFWASLAPKAAGPYEGMCFEHVPRQMRDYTLYLPLFTDAASFEVLVDDDAELQAAPPFLVDKPIVFYGTSITHGAAASRPGLTYESVLCRALNLDFVNMGFNGMGKGERAVATAMAEIDAACYVLDFGGNHRTAREFGLVFLPFAEELRRARPDTPIVLTTPQFDAGEQYKEEFRALQNAKRQVVIDTYDKLAAAGDRALYLLQWNQFAGLVQGDGLQDGCHPNDYGFWLMATALKDTVLRAIGKTAQAQQH